jgi:hypothetical protein
VDPELVEGMLGVYRDRFQNDRVRGFSFLEEALYEWIRLVLFARLGSAFGKRVERLAVNGKGTVRLEPIGGLGQGFLGA